MLSAINSSGGSNLAQWIQSFQKQQASQLASGNTGLPGMIPTSSQSSGGGAQKSTNLLSGNTSQTFTQIRQAVTTALQKAQLSHSSQNPNQIVQSTIASLLKNLGFGSSTTAASNLAAAEINGQGPEANGSPSSAEGFQKILASSGISPQQFQSDLMSAIQNVQGGATNPFSSFSSIPVGSMLDVTG
jgi:hypothetical protein